MTINYNGTDNWKKDIRLKAVSDKVLGGLDQPANVASQDLADCTVYLKNQDFRDMKEQMEIASGGNATIRRDSYGVIDYFYKINKFQPVYYASIGFTYCGNYTGIWSPTRLYHPAFYVNGTLKDYLLMSIFPAVKKTISSTDLWVPQSSPTFTGTPSVATARTMATAKGTGYHLMNLYEHGAVSLISLRFKANLKGNDYVGAHYATASTVNNGGYAPNIDYLTGYSYGCPSDWRHNNEPWGIVDLVGNKYEFLDGIYINNGQIYTYSTRDNYYTETEASWTATGLYYSKPGSNLEINTTSSTSGTYSLDYNSLPLVTTTGANTLTDSTWISDLMLCRQNNQPGHIVSVPAMAGVEGHLQIDTTKPKAYFGIGGDRTGAGLSKKIGLGAKGAIVDPIYSPYFWTPRICLFE